MSIDRSVALDALNTFGANRQHTILVLQDAIDDQERLADDHHPLAIEEIGANDDVRDAGLVLEREKHESFRRSGTLARNDHAGHAHAAAVECAGQICGAHHAAQRQIAEAQRHRMRPDGQAQSRIVGLQALARIHGSQGRAGWWLVVSGWWLGFGLWALGFWLWALAFGEKLASGPDSPFDLPQCAASFVGERVERADVSERRQLVAAKAGALDDIL